MVSQPPEEEQAEAAATDIGGKHQLRGRLVRHEDSRELRHGRQYQVGPCQRQGCTKDEEREGDAGACA